MLADQRQRAGRVRVGRARHRVEHLLFWFIRVQKLEICDEDRSLCGIIRNHCADGFDGVLSDAGHRHPDDAAGRATEQPDCQTELNDSPSGHFSSDDVNQDLSALQSDAVTWANTNGNSIDSQAHRIDSERNPSATANEPGFPVRRGSNGYYLQ